MSFLASSGAAHRLWILTPLHCCPSVSSLGQATFREAAMDIRARFDANKTMPNFMKAREALAAGQVGFLPRLCQINMSHARPK